MTTLGVFRVCVFATLKTVKQLSLSNLQVALHVSARQQGCLREDLPPSVLFFIGTLSQTMTLRAPLFSIPLTPFSRGQSGPTGFPSPQRLSLPASSGPASDDALSLSFGRCFFACIVLKKRLPMLGTHDAACKSLFMTALDVFRVGIFATLKTIKQLSLSNLQVTQHVSSPRYLL